MGVAIHPELYFEIVRPMVKELAQSDLPFRSYDQITVKLYHYKNNGKKMTIIWP